MPTTGITTTLGSSEPATLTVVQFAHHLQCDAKTIHRRIKKGIIKAVKIGRLVRIPRSELERLLTTSGPPSPLNDDLDDHIRRGSA